MIMKIFIKPLILLFFLSNLNASLFSQTSKASGDKLNPKEDKIQWLTFAEAVKQNKKKPKKIFMDVYTDWCGWCKKYDAVTFSHPLIAKYINENFYAVKFDAEMKEAVSFKGKTYINQNPNGRRQSHDLAIYLLKGQMSYPTVVFLDEKMDLLSAVPGYRGPKDFESVINFFGSNAYKNKDFEDYINNFRGKIAE